MSRLGGWLRPSKKAEAPQDSVPDAEFAGQQARDLDDAMRWAGLIMNDDIDGAWVGLQNGDSSFHDLGAAIVFFMRSILGFEKQVMAEAVQKLNDCEVRIAADLKQAQRTGARPGSLYPPGTEYELVRALTQLMGAVVGVLHESLIEAMKSFYKLRKAFLTLDAIIATENKLLGAQLSRPISVNSFKSSKVSDAGDKSAKGSQVPSVVSEAGNDTDTDDEFVDAKEEISEQQTPDPSQPPTIITTPDPESQLSEAMSKAKINESNPSLRLTASPSELLDEIDLGDDPINIFIHSGANMCFGILLLILTLVPPAFSKILSVVGFRGDRGRAVRMLWRSTVFPNINGAIASMTLLAYYFGLLGLVDILPDAKDYDEEAQNVGPPREKCRALLGEMRARYPDSSLWRLEESRQLASTRELPKSIELLTTGQEPKMKQVAALIKFELAISAMFVQDWVLMRDTFEQCIDINDWSPSMYEFNAGCASLELYRDAVQSGDKDKAKLHKKAAEESLRKAPTLAGKKRLMARQLPIETLVQRKLGKWEERAKRLGVDLADAVGTSPAMEMCYLWNGPKRMGTQELERGLANLEWTRCTGGQAVVEDMQAEKDEMAVWALSKSVLLRNLNRLDEARKLLDEHVLCYDRTTFKGPTKDDYVLPAATYELGVMAWVECCNPPAGRDAGATAEYRRAKLEECAGYLDTAKAWETYVMDTRIGLRVQSGLETLDWFRKKMGWQK
ncbi:Inclusion body clearance protein IML2 [Paramyrothecium foliicola]|nr:Inclusion body clearance protein IML2 [Paramyrothecium foliicola]